MAEMKDKSWVCDLAFLIDTTICMNELNTKLQRKAQYVSEMYGHIKGFINKLRLWHAHIQNANLAHFPTLKEMGILLEKKTEFADQLQQLLNEFSACFKLKTSNPTNIYLKYFLHHFTLTLKKSPWISKWI